MKANELTSRDLMVGDWVYITDHPMRKEAKQVKPEHLLRSLVIFEPIPLTTEILEKNGFNEPPLEMQKSVRFVVLCEEYQINYYFNINWFSIYKNAGVNGSDYPVFICAFQERIKYVHELQHALRLCKIEEEIVI